MAQNEHRLVQPGPKRRNVAVPRLKHSNWLGQWASTQTVLSLRSLIAAITVDLFPDKGSLRLSHEGFDFVKFTFLKFPNYLENLNHHYHLSKSVKYIFLIFILKILLLGKIIYGQSMSIMSLAKATLKKWIHDVFGYFFR
jgi:hypothetical protein